MSASHHETLEGVDVLDSPVGLTIYHKGPSFHLGPLPSVFYFALSGSESLTLDPFNQPVVFLAQVPIRVFSFTIPAHGEGYKSAAAIEMWMNAFTQNDNIVDKFIEQSRKNIDFLIEQKLIDERALVVSGLSRGAFLATHLAAKDHRLRFLLGFAPMMRLDTIQELRDFSSNPLAQSLALENLVEQLISTQVRFYIGNRDTRVGTEACFHFIKKLADTAFSRGVRSPQVEMVISPSIGHKGHGTSSEVFQDGVAWIKKKLEVQK